MAESTPAPSEPHSSRDILSFVYGGNPLRVTRLCGGFWYGSSGLARALGWVDSASIARCLGGDDRLRIVTCKGRRLMLVDHATLLDVAALAKPARAVPFLRWLDQVLRARFGADAPAIPADLLIDHAA